MAAKKGKRPAPNAPDRPLAKNLDAEVPDGEEVEPTMFRQVLDPGILKLHAELPKDNLEGMQKVLGRCTVEHVSPALEGFNFQGFVHNLRGISKVELGEVKLYALLTRHNAFVFTNAIAEELHDKVQGLMDLQLADRVVLKDADKPRYLYRVPSEQIERLRTIANRNRLHTAQAFPFADLAGFKKRLATCAVEEGTLDLADFASRVRSVSNLYEDRDGVPYHHLVLGGGAADEPFVLYVNPTRLVPGATFLRCGPVRLALARES